MVANKKKKISELFNFLPKSKIKAGEGLENGKYPFYTCSNELTKYYDEYTFEPNKLIFGTGGSASLHYASEPFATSTDCYVIEAKELNVDVKYVYYYLKNNFQILEDGFKGAGLKHISKDYLSNIMIEYPDIEEQQRIVKILDKADEIRTKKKLANEKLDEFIKSMFLIYYKKGIQERKLEELCEFITKGTTPKKHDMSQGEGDIPYIKVYNLLYDTKLDFSINPTFITKKAHKQELARSIVYPNDVLMNIVGPPLGKVSIVPNIFPEWNINQAIVRFRCKTELNYRYLDWFLTTPYAMKQMIKSAKKTSGQLNLTLDICRKLLIPIPPIDLQNQFAQIVQKVEAQKGKNQKVIEQMDNLFNSLMQQAFNSSL